MKKCFIIGNIENKLINHTLYSWVGSNMVSFLITSIIDIKEYKPVVLNVGAPHRFARSLSKTTVCSFDAYDVAEFKSGTFLLPNRFRAKIIIRNAIYHLLKEFDDGDVLIIYHSLSYSHFYSKILKKCGLNNCILLTAEVYSDVIENNKKQKKRELESLSYFKKYIAMSNGIKQTLLSLNSNGIIIMLYGVYKVNNINEKLFAGSKKKKNAIDLVYSGTTSKEKNGLYMALNAMQYLPDGYVLHVFCDEADKYALNAIKKTKNTVYEGYVAEQDLLLRLSSFDIGLATQNPYLPFNKTSFPSKVTTYFLSGLLVICSQSESVVNSPFANEVEFFEYDPIKLAESIVKIANTHSNVSKRHSMDLIYKDYLNELRSLIKDNENTYN